MPLFQFSTPSGPRLVLPFIRACRVIEERVCPDSGRRVDLALTSSRGCVSQSATSIGNTMNDFSIYSMLRAKR